MSSRFVFLGPPGAGKGTQAAAVSQTLGIPIIGTGSIFRDAIAKGSPLGLQISHYVHDGLLVPDKLTNAVVTERLKHKDCKKGFILDGFPRSIAQATSLDVMLEKYHHHHRLDSVLYFKVEPDVVASRMGNRRVCSGCGRIYNIGSQPPKVEGVCDDCGSALVMRSDDKPEAIKRRLEIYEETTSLLRHHFEERGLLHVIDASGPVQDVTRAVLNFCLRKPN